MIDEKKLAQVKAMTSDQAPASFELATLTPAELRRLRSDIDKLLPQETLADMDMPRELVAQFKRVKDLQDEVLDDDLTPANQKAQVAGQVAATLQQLVKMQTDFYTSERFRAIENLMIKFMRTMPLEQASEFLDEYEKLAAGV